MNGDTESPQPEPRLSRRHRFLLAGAGGTALLCLAVLLISTQIRSPAQVAAETRAPDRTMLTATVLRRTLTDTVVLRGTVVQTRTVEVRPASVFEAERVVVTGVRVKAGQQVRHGDVLAEISGRPVIVLPGTFPAYRDIRPGARGKDVAQLQRALRRMGYRVADEAVLGPSTKQALSRLYDSLGYQVPSTGAADEEAVRAAQARVRQARQALRQAKANPASGTAETATAPGATGTAGGSGPTGTTVAAAREALAQAQTDLAALIARTGPMVPMGEVVFVPQLPARVVKVNAAIGRELSGALATLAVGDVVAIGKLPGAGAQGVEPGQPVKIMVSASGETIAGKVVAAGDEAAAMAGSAATEDDDQGKPSDSVGPSGYQVAVSGNKPLAAKLIGQTVRLSVVVSDSAEPVLVVPVAAVSSGADAQTTVTVVDPSGASRVVPVIVDGTGDGYVAVSAPDGRLRQGDSVAVGLR